jgi:PHD/YefM family antitoxin component YafN of YafNO toxin-antitoxin module
MSDGSSFKVMTIEDACARLTQLHGRVCRDKGRVEIEDAEGCCVLISKEELETLEQALEILSNTSAVKKIAGTIATLTDSAARGPLVTERAGAN